VSGFAVACLAQEPAPPPPPAPPGAPAVARQPDARDITGRDFAGLRIAETVHKTGLTLEGRQVYFWTEEPPPGAPGGGQPTQRFFLRGDVRVAIDTYQFVAAQAGVWLETLPAEPGKETRRQVAVYFDRVSDPGAQAGVAQAADRLLLTGIVEGDLTLRPALLVRARPTDEFVREAEARLARLLRQIAGAPPGPEPRLPTPPGVQPIQPGVSRPYEPGSPLGRPEVPPEVFARDLPPAEERPPIFAEQGILTVAWQETQSIRLVRGEEDNAAVVSGSLVVQYSDARSGASLHITAGRAVVFFDPGPWTEVLATIGTTSLEAPAGKVRGVYLEGGVIASDGRYTIRGDRLYYDVRENRALLVDAVFWAYDDRRGLPLYVRAREIRQLSRTQFAARSPTVATSSFFEPHLSLGATSVTLTQSQTPSGRDRTIVDARNVTIRAGKLPFFYFPRFRGDVNNIPLRQLSFTNSSSTGAAVKSAWDFMSLLGVDAGEDFDWELLLDGYFERGPAIGSSLGWSTPTSNGDLFGYTIFNDTGTDQLVSGAEIDQDGQTRGIVYGEHRWALDDKWTVFLETSYISDETFVDAFFEPLAENRREFTNAGRLRRIAGNTEFDLLGKGELNDFTPNEYLLQSQGYNSDKLPEGSYYRVNDDLLAGVAPGLLSYTSEYRAGRLALNFTEPTAAELGFNTVDRSQAAFGLNPDQSLGNRLRAQGFSESDVFRFDTRHELGMPLKAGPVTVTPFATGRITAYDQDFSDFSPDSDEQVRLWGAVGARIATTLTRINDLIDSRLFDLHRTRHIVEPSVTVWTAAANLDQNDLPVYDQNVESIATGSVVKTGVTQTWQTQRGSHGRWHTVDVLKLSTDVFYSSEDADKESPIGRFFDWRPEYSLLGDFATVDGVWQVSDAVAITAGTVYDLDLNQPARTIAGGKIQHSQDFSTFAEARYINARDITLVSFGATQRITRKYTVTGSATLDTDEGDLQFIGGTVRREFPQVTLGMTVGYDNISGETSIGMVLEPQTDLARRRQLQQRLGPVQTP
jgi:hypothetical protein